MARADTIFSLSLLFEQQALLAELSRIGRLIDKFGMFQKAVMQGHTLQGKVGWDNPDDRKWHEVSLREKVEKQDWCAVGNYAAIL